MCQVTEPHAFLIFLSSDDVDRTTFAGKRIFMVHIKWTPHERANTYKILGGFDGEPALLKFAKIESPSEGMSAIQGYKQVRCFVDDEILRELIEPSARTTAGQ